jgi:HD-like signal output (HDOD) protein/CheY-like chemotaxis protein
MGKKKRVLFVDDDSSVLDGLRRTLHCMLDEWEMTFVTNAKDALAAMNQSPYDIVVSDIRMPHVGGVQLLEQIRSKFPSAIRLALSGYTDQQLMSKSARCAHQLLTKPCEPEQLKQAVRQACALHEKLYSETVRKVVSNLKSLPAMPATYQRVIDLIASPDSSLRQVGKIVASDIGMSAKILQVVNSAYYGLRHRITDPIHAVVYLGQKTVQALVLTNGIFSKLEQNKVEKFAVAALQDHCIRVGGLAKAICESWRMDKKQLEDATMAGILHDAGKIILIAKLPDQLAAAIEISRRQQIPLYQAEQQLIGTTHAELGGYLMGLWDLPSIIVESAAFHHAPSQSAGKEFSVVMAVHIANALDHELCCGLGDGACAALDMDYLAELGAVQCLEKWRRLHLPVAAEEYECAQRNS